MHLELEDKNFAGVMEGHQNEFKTTKSQEELVEESLANPYGSPSLEELCAGKKDIVIISSDHTRPVPSRVTMPILLHHIHSAAPEARVRILVATGMHRPSTHEAGCEFVKSLAGVEPVECEIAITTNGGYPLDQNIYQAVKGMCSAEATLPEGGVIIDVAGCADGHGGEGFYHNIADNDPAEFERACIDRPKDETLPDQWTSQIFARILAHHPVIMVTDLCDHQMIKDMHMTPVNTLDEALKLAFEMKGADAKVAVIPDGLGVVVAQH
ncbi:lactate racemase domain-containing protein [Collinsella sp. CLA-SR-H006]|uniref:lactate racemase domain-containing protein n=1 Tax=Collinsella sp. CLA-SR-H006 TaxID=3136228 RepID=UPI0032C10138